MSSELWAIVSAAAWAADSILVRKGTAFSNPSTAALISFSVNAAVLVPYIIYQYPAEKIFQSANLFFVLSGIIQPAIVCCNEASFAHAVNRKCRSSGSCVR